MLLNSTNLTTVDTAIRTAFNERLTGVETTFGKIAMTVPSTTKTQEYPSLSMMSGMREWIGDRVINRLGIETFSITNRKFEKTIAISRDEIEDDQYGVYTPIASDLGQTAAELPDELVWEMLEKGFDTTHYDGQNFFDTDHPVRDADDVEQSVSNFTAGAGAAWYLVDTTRMIKPLIFQNRRAATITAKTRLTDDNVFDSDEFVWGADRRCAAGFGAWELIHASKQPLTAANYAAVRKAMLEMRGDGGRKLNLRPNLLVVSAENEGAAREILMAERNAAGATNVWRNTAELHVETRLSA